VRTKVDAAIAMGIERFGYRTVDLLGHELRLRLGAHRFGVDYDHGWLLRLLKESNVLIDVGCNVGHVALVAALENPQRRIICVDPNPFALAVAAESLAANGFAERCQFFAAFVSDTDDETVDFYTVATGAAGSRHASHAHTAAAHKSYQEVQTLTLDTIVERSSQAPDLIKIDVEGAELEVLAGATSTVAAYQPRVFVEMHALAERPMTEAAATVIAWCNRHDYRAWYLAEHAELSDPDQIAHRGRCHLLFQPASDGYPERLATLPQSTSYEEAADLLRTH
jgi:FkbM family methyltransferase